MNGKYVGKSKFSSNFRGTRSPGSRLERLRHCRPGAGNISYGKRISRKGKRTDRKSSTESSNNCPSRGAVPKLIRRKDDFLDSSSCEGKISSAVESAVNKMASTMLDKEFKVPEQTVESKRCSRLLRQDAQDYDLPPPKTESGEKIPIAGIVTRSIEDDEILDGESNSRITLCHCAPRTTLCLAFLFAVAAWFKKYFQ